MDIVLIIRRESNYDELELTEAGKCLYYSAKSILNQKGKLLTDIEAIKKKKTVEKETVSIVTNAPIGAFALPKLIERYRLRFDRLDLKVIIETDDYPSMVSLVQNKICDIGIIHTDISVPFSTLVSTFDQKISLFAKKDIPLHTIRDFEKIPLVMLPKSFFTIKLINSFFSQNNISPNIVLELNEPFAIRELIKTENYFSILHDLIIEEDIRRGELVKVKTPFELPLINYKIVINRESAKQDTIKEITVFLKDNLSNN